MKVEKLSRTLQKILAARGLSGRLDIFRIIGQWEVLVGDVIARHTQPLSLKGKKLSVQVDSSVWMQQLSLLKPELIEKVNRGLGEGTITNVTVALGEVKRRSGRREASSPLPPLSDEERMAIDRYTETVREPEIREAIRKVMEMDWKNKKRETAGDRSRKPEAGA